MSSAHQKIVYLILQDVYLVQGKHVLRHVKPKTVMRSGVNGNKLMQYNSKSIIALNWKAEAFLKIFLVKITDHSIHHNFVLSNICAIRYCR